MGVYLRIRYENCWMWHVGVEVGIGSGLGKFCLEQSVDL